MGAMSQNRLLLQDRSVYSLNRPLLAATSAVINPQDRLPSSWADKLAGFWCGLMHGGATWPIHGRYHCRQCNRLYIVPWK